MKWLSWIGVPALTFAYYGQYPYRLLIEQGTYQLADSSSGRYVAQTTTKGAGRFAVGCYRTPILTSRKFSGATCGPFVRGEGSGSKKSRDAHCVIDQNHVIVPRAAGTCRGYFPNVPTVVKIYTQCTEVYSNAACMYSNHMGVDISRLFTLFVWLDLNISS